MPNTIQVWSPAAYLSSCCPFWCYFQSWLKLQSRDQTITLLQCRNLSHLMCHICFVELITVRSGLNHMCWRGHAYAAKTLWTFSRLLDCSLNWPQQIKKWPQLVGYKRAVLLPQLLHCPHWPLLVITRAQNNSSFLQTGVLPDHQGTISQDI